MMADGRTFRDRTEAGRLLAGRLTEMQFADPIVYALPRGGVPVAFEVARALGAPLDLVLVRKIGVPFQPELAAGAVVDGDRPEIVVNEEVARMAGLDRSQIEEMAQEKLTEIERRRTLYLKDRAQPAVEGRDAVVIDDGIATGATVRASLRALANRGAKRVILAVPVAPQDTLQALTRECDEIVCLDQPEPFYAIGLHYADFTQTTDEEVVALLEDAARLHGAAGSAGEAS